MDEQFNWYAIYTRPRAEKKVYKSLVENGFEAYLPLMTTVRQWSDRKKKVQLPLISSYVFVRTRLEKLNTTLNITGCVGILKHLKSPAVIKDHEIENLRILTDCSEAVKLSENIMVQKGDMVLVERGVFKGLVAECIELKGKRRIIIRINALQCYFEINIPLNYLAKL